MSFALTWTAAALARATGRDRDFPAGTLELLGVAGPWGRACEALGWVEVIRRCATETDITAMFAPYQKEALAAARATVRDAAKRLLSGGGTASSADVLSGTPTLFEQAAKHPSLAETLALTPLHVFVADDVATSVGWVLDPAFVREHLVPLYARLSHEITHTAESDGLAGTVAGFHSDGDIGELYPDLAAAGYRAVHLASVDYHAISRLAGGAAQEGMVAFGGIATETLEGGEVADEICRLMARTAASDGLVVADDAGVTAGHQLDVLARAFTRVGLY